jgi:hypothetical protein
MLIESAVVLVVTTVGLLAILQLFAACSQHSRAAVTSTNAMLLAGQVEAAMAGLPFQDPARGGTFGPESGETLSDYDDVDDFDGRVFNPPIDSLRRPIPELRDFSQTVIVAPLHSTQLSSSTGTAPPVVAKTTYTGNVRVTVRILYAPAPARPSAEVYRRSWVCVDR